MLAAGWRNWVAGRKEKRNLLFTVYTLICFDFKLCVHIPLKIWALEADNENMYGGSTQQMVLNQ